MTASRSCPSVRWGLDRGLTPGRAETRDLFVAWVFRVDLDHPEAPVQPHLDLVHAQPEADLDHAARVALHSDHPTRAHVPERGPDRPLALRSPQLVRRGRAGGAALFVEAAQP